MDVVFQKYFVQDLKQPVIAHYCGDLMFTGDALCDTITVSLFDDGVAYSVGGTVACKVIRADGETVPVTGTSSGNTISATLIPACYAIPGPLTVIMKVISNGVTATVLKAVYTVDISETGTTVDPGTIIPDVSALIQAIEDATASVPADYSDLLAAIAPDFSPTEPYPVGRCVWYDGELYQFIVPHVAGSWAGSEAVKVPTLGGIGNVLNEQNLALKYTLNPVDWTFSVYKGQRIVQNTGAVGSHSKSCRTTAHDGFGAKIAVEMTGSVYRCNMFYYDSTCDISNGTGYLGCSGYRSGMLYIPDNAVKIALSFNRLDGANMQDSDVTAIKAAVKAYRLTDDTLAKSDKAADAKAVGDAVASLKDAYMASMYSTTFPSFVQGSLKTTDGTDTSSDTRIRSSVYIPGYIRAVAPKTGYKMSVYVYDASDSYAYKGTIAQDGSIAKGVGSDAMQTRIFGLWTYPDNYSFRLVLAKTDDANITPSDYANAILYSYTDVSLTVEGIPADAKAVRDAVTNLENAMAARLYASSLQTFEQGTISTISGANSSSATRIRTNGYIPGYVQAVAPKTNYKIAVYVYDASDSYTYKGTITQDGSIEKGAGSGVWLADTVELWGYPSNYSYRLIMAKTDDSTIDPSAYANAIIYSYTDASLTAEGIPADAKATGDQLYGKAYIKTEADRVSANVRAAQTGKTLTFIGVSDMHYNVDSASGQEALRDMAEGVKAIAGQVHIDFYCDFGDIIYRLSSNGDYDKGYAEALGMTKLLNDCFGNNDQIRLVGNHDPNTEGNTGYFPLNLMNSFAGIYTNMIEKTGNKNIGTGYVDLEDRKVRVIVLNTSYYTENTTLSQSSTRYYFGNAQAEWLCGKMAELSEKNDASEWQIMILAHIAPNYVSTANSWAKIAQFCDIFRAYEAGDTASWTVSGTTSTYNFSGKNTAKLALYINGHRHRYYANVMEHLDSSGEVDTTLKMTTVEIPHALYEPTASPADRAGESMDGVTYTKTANSATSTSFSVITIDFDNHIVYAHHYGAGVDIILHYDSQDVESTLTLETNLTSPTWSVMHSAVATVSGGVVTAAVTSDSIRNTVVFAKSETDNCIEAWNIHAGNTIA